MTEPGPPSSDISISVIAPVYNVAPFVEACLQSIERQSFDQPYEVLMIDDCSTDHSADICRKFAEQHPARFRFLQNPENRGVSATRNLGLDNARGRYFMFVDPDDLLPLDALETLFSAAEKHASPLVKGNNTIFDEHGESPARYDVDRSELIEGEAVLTTLYQHNKVRGHPWGKFFRRDSFGKYRFPLGVRMAQDLFYCSEVFSHSESLLLLNHTVYRYRNRDSGSTGTKYKTGSYLHWLDSVEKTLQFARTPAQRRAHKELMLRTMTQVARECRKLPAEEAARVLKTIEQRCAHWQIRLLPLLLKDRLGPRALLRQFKLQQALRQTRKLLLRAPASERET